MTKYISRDYQAIGNRIMSYRKRITVMSSHGKRKAASQSDLIALLRERNLSTIGRNTLSDLENGIEEAFIGMSLAQWDALCTIFDCSIGHLLGEYECHNYDTQFIHEQTCLSEKAIMNLCHYDDSVVTFISYLLESGLINPIGLKASICIDKLLMIQHYTKNVLPTLNVNAKESLHLSEEGDILANRSKVIDEIARLQEVHDATLWRCNKYAGSAIDTFISEEMKKYGND